MSNYDADLDMDSRNSLSLIINRIAKNSTILEFGPANGRMTKYLKETMGCTVYAVELDNESAKDAAEFCEEILIGDIENLDWLGKYKDIGFDYIIFADVLEHLYNPKKVLTKAKTLLKPEGSILMSLPNIAHNAIIMDLMEDRFTYSKTGLLDNTHIRFFTKSTLEQLIIHCGLEIAYETATYENPSNTEFKNNYSDFDSSVAQLLGNREFGEAYQFVFEAKHNASNLITDFIKEDIASLYIDTGNGFNETEKITTVFSYNVDKAINFRLKTKVHNVKAIRIDPLEMALSIKLENILVNTNKVTNNIKHNGIEGGDEEIKFFHNDPQFLIDFDDAIILQTVTLNYESIKEEYVTKSDQINQQYVHTLKSKINEQSDTLTAQKQRIDELRRQRAKKTQTIKNQKQHVGRLKSKISEQSDKLTVQTQNITIQEQHIGRLEKKIFNLDADIQSMRLINKVRRFFGSYKNNPTKRKNSDNNNVLAIVIHVFYLDVFKEILAYIDNIEESLKLYVTTPYRLKDDIENLLEKGEYSYYLLPIENKGRDVLPFLKIMPVVIENGHLLLLKLHTKKSEHRKDGSLWRNDIFDKLLLPNKSKQITQQLSQRHDLGMVGPQGHIVSMKTHWESNEQTVLNLAERMGVDKKTCIMSQQFVAGTMFYARISAIKPLLDIAISEDDFEIEVGQVDGTLAHGIERAFSLSLVVTNMNLVSSDTLEPIDLNYAENIYHSVK